MENLKIYTKLCLSCMEEHEVQKVKILEENAWL